MFKSTTLNLQVATPDLRGASIPWEPKPASFYRAGSGSVSGFYRAKPELLSAVYTLCEAGEMRRALRRCMSELDGKLRLGKTDEVDSILSSIDVSRVLPEVLLGILTVSAHARPEDLPSRPRFVQRAEVRVRALLGDERAERLLRRRR